ncbi:MAG: hypothetical protein ACFE0Q_04370 [Anaerolineae bacterium]
MPVSVHLHDDQTHMIYEFQEPLDIDELMEAYREEKQFRDSIPHTLHSIVDMSTIRRIPPNWLVAKAGPGLTHPRSGRMLFVGLSHGLRIIIQTILKITRYERMKFFETRAEAEAFMTELVKETHPDLQKVQTVGATASQNTTTQMQSTATYTESTATQSEPDATQAKTTETKSTATHTEPDATQVETTETKSTATHTEPDVTQAENVSTANDE